MAKTLAPTPVSPGAIVPSVTRGQVVMALLAVYIVWGSTYLGIRMAIESIPPLLMAGARSVFAGLLMIGFAKIWLKTPWPTRAQWRNAAIVGACLLCGGNGGVTLAELVLPTGLAALLVTTVPMFMLLFGWWAGVTPRPGWIVLGALALGWVGVGLLVHSTGTPPVGGTVAPTLRQFYGSVALILGAAAVWAAGSLFAKYADKPPSAILSVGTQMLLGGGLLVFAGTGRGEWAQLDWHGITARSGWAFVYLTFVGSLVGFSAYVWLLGACSPTLVGTYAFINPAVAVLLGWAILGEAVTPVMFFGMGVILAAVALIVLFPAKARPQQL